MSCTGCVRPPKKKAHHFEQNKIRHQVNRPGGNDEQDRKALPAQGEHIMECTTSKLTKHLLT